MGFDAFAVLERLRSETDERATRATTATQTPEAACHVAQVARVARGAGLKTGDAGASPPTGESLPSAKIIHLARGPGLSTQPASCAGCGKADWRVAMRTADGRTWHVACWKAERIDGASK